MKISIIVPCYNNAANFPLTAKTLYALKDKFPDKTALELIFVDDGSKDETFSALESCKRELGSTVKLVKLVRNFGTNNAVLAGLHHATGDCIAVISADLQDPPELLPKMFDYWTKGFKLVLGTRASRQDAWFEALPARFFHALMRKIALPHSPSGGFDFLLYDKVVRDTVLSMNERDTWLPYLYVWCGYEYVTIPYERRKRTHGRSQWTLKKKLNSFVDSVVGFSKIPVRALWTLGVGLIGFALLGSLTSAFLTLTTAAWIALGAFLFLGVQLLGMGILGEYLWRISEGTKKRPSFIVDRVVDQ